MVALNVTFEDFQAAMRPLFSEASYLVLSSRAGRKDEERLARFNLTRGAVAADDNTDDVDGDGDDDGEDPDEVEEQLSPRELRKRISEIYTWLESTTENNLDDEGQGRFRLRLYGVKGATVLQTWSIRAEGDPEDREEPSTTVSTEISPEAELRLDPTDANQKLLGLFFWAMEKHTHATQRHIQVIGGSLSEFIRSGRVQQQQWEHLVRQMSGHNAELREQVQEILTALVGVQAARAAELGGDGASQEPVPKKGKREQQTEIANKALDQIGKALDALITRSGVPADLMDTAKELLGNDKVAELLRRPGIKKVLKDPEGLRELTEQLEFLAKQAEAADAEDSADADDSEESAEPDEGPEDEPPNPFPHLGR